jgi:D-alanine-D-alanine ligase
MIKVGVIRGGISDEYEISLKTGANILSCLRGDRLKDKYKAIDILLDKEGCWYVNGTLSDLSKIHKMVDVVFNALHGDYGEDGKIQQELEQWKIPYTGSKPFASALGYNKELSKKTFAKLGIKTPRHILFSAYLEDLDGSKEEYAERKSFEVIRQLPPPWIVKPLTGGSSMGIHVCKTFDELVFAFNDSLNKKVSILVEELIEGREATVAVIDNFRDKELYALPPIEIKISKDKKFFDYESKYSSVCEEVCPGCFNKEDKEELENLAKIIHSGMNLSHYSRSDFIIHPKKGIYAIEVNTLPGLTDESLTPKALLSVGSSMSEFVDHVINLAIRRR